MTNLIKIVGEGTLEMGQLCSIGEGVTVVFAKSGRVVLGDYVSLGDNVRMIVDGGTVRIGDWTTLHPNCLVMAEQYVTIGQHCWFGQNTVIDGTGGLTIGDGVRVGMYSQLWTHVAAGEQIEGCTLYGKTPTHIAKDAWLVGSCVVGSGVNIGERTVALAGSNIVKDTPAHSVVAGAPAKVKEGLSFYREVSLDEKMQMLEGWLREMLGASVDASNTNSTSGVLTVRFDDAEMIRFFKTSLGYDSALTTEYVTDVCVETKQYRKRLTGTEHTVMKYLAGNKARYYSN